MEKILTLHPQGKSGVHISKHNYERIKSAIIGFLLVHKTLTHTQLLDFVEKEVGKDLSGSVPWYVEVVRLDLEARKLICRKGKTDVLYSMAP